MPRSSASRGAHAFSLAYGALLRGLAPALGGAAWLQALGHTEVAVWWCRGLDPLLDSDALWTGPRQTELQAALAAVAQIRPRPWGEVQQVRPSHPLAAILGPLAGWLGLAGPAMPLPGTLATVCQGNCVPTASGANAVAPAYRMVCDLSAPGLWAGGAGPVDARPSAAHLQRQLQAWAAGQLHERRAPRADEARTPPRT